MGKGKNIRFIFNPKSGLIHPVQYIKKAIEYYFPKNLCSYDFNITMGKNHAYELACEAVEKGYDIVVAIGGDGTVNETASGLVNSDTSLGIIPIGSGNGFARGLGIPLMIRRAARMITVGQYRAIDVGQIGDRYFFVIAGLGFDAVIGKRFEDGKIRGPAPYYLAGLTEFFRYHAPLYIIKFDNRVIRTNALVVAIANIKQYGNNAIIAPNAKPDDGLFDLAIIQQTNLVETVYYLPTLFTGNIDKTPYTKIYRATKFQITREFPAPYTLDGEVYDGEKCVTVTMLPKALKVIVNDINF